MKNKILNMKMTNFQLESRDMTTFGKKPMPKSGQISFILP